MKKKVLLIGGCGFLGSHLSGILLDNNYEIIIFDKKNINKQNIQHLKGKMNLIEGDFLNEIDLKKALKGMDYIIHLGYTTLPFTSIDNIVYDIETNVVSSIKLLNLIKDNTKQKIIFISSGGTVYGNINKLPIDENNYKYTIDFYCIMKFIN